MKKRIHYLKTQDLIFKITGSAILFLTLLLLGFLILDMFLTGYKRLSFDFLIHFPSRFAEHAGIFSAWVGSIVIVLLTALMFIPFGIMTALYLEEYAAKNLITKIIELSIQNLAGVPSVIYGLMALSLFVMKFKMGQSILTASCTLGLLILPIVIVTTREALKTVPNSVKEASYSLGATKWQTVFFHVLPYSMGGIMTGIIVAISRAIGETAPLVTVGALTYIAFLPTNIMDPYTVLPIQLFNWISRPQKEFHENAAAAAVILIVLTLTLNIIAIRVRYKFRRKYKW
jgi:phosphate transport system permease protein